MGFIIMKKQFVSSSPQLKNNTMYDMKEDIERAKSIFTDADRRRFGFSLQSESSLEYQILSIIQDGKDKGYEPETILQSIKSELTRRKYV